MLVDKLKALADETRLGIINHLFSGKKSVSQIVMHVKKSQPSVSISLKQLTFAGIVKRTRSGKNIYYELMDMVKIKRLLELLKEGAGNE